LVTLVGTWKNVVYIDDIFFQFFKINCFFLFFMIYDILIVLYCTKDIFEFFLYIAMIVLLP
ncbi:hypothetical protein LDENG_00047870, partial [Lucifuga dentata]